MKILFSPSEGKSLLGESAPISTSHFCCESLYERREELLSLYQGYIRCANTEQLSHTFGIKKKEEIDKWHVDIFAEPTQKAIKRYTGVAYEYLKYNTLSPREQAYIDANTIIFSNLFGPLRASDNIPPYKLKQGLDVCGVKPEKFYHTYFSDALDKMFEDEIILDLRAGFYEKFYTLKQPYTTLKFIKNGKVVSHWAKAYRGIILRAFAQKNICTTVGLEDVLFDGLSLVEISTKKFKTQLTYEIVPK